TPPSPVRVPVIARGGRDHLEVARPLPDDPATSALGTEVRFCSPDIDPIPRARHLNALGRVWTGGASVRMERETSKVASCARGCPGVLASTSTVIDRPDFWVRPRAGGPSGWWCSNVPPMEPRERSG